MKPFDLLAHIEAEHLGLHDQYEQTGLSLAEVQAFHDEDHADFAFLNHDHQEA